MAVRSIAEAHTSGILGSPVSNMEQWGRLFCIGDRTINRGRSLAIRHGSTSGIDGRQPRAIERSEPGFIPRGDGVVAASGLERTLAPQLIAKAGGGPF
jgi:hypothetical protein